MAKLCSAGFDPTLPTLFLFEGVSYYLPDCTVEATFADISLCTDARVCYDVFYDWFSMHPATVALMQQGFGEPFHSGVQPGREGASAVRAHLRIVDVRTSKSINKHYAPRTSEDEFSCPAFSCFAFVLASTQSPGHAGGSLLGLASKPRGVEVRQLSTYLMPDMVDLQAERLSKVTFLESWHPGGSVSRITFKGFSLRVASARAALHSCGIACHDRMAFLCHASIESQVLLLATMSIGAVPVMLSWSYPHDALCEMCRHVGVASLISSRAFAESARQLTAAMSCHLLFLHAVPEGTGTVLPLDDNLPAVPPADLDPRSIAIIMFTSGSTASPKAVPLTHCGLTWLFAAKSAAEDYESCHKHGGTLCFLPWFHVMGLCNNFLFNLYE